jgi:hypothetical protein
VDVPWARPFSQISSAPRRRNSRWQWSTWSTGGCALGKTSTQQQTRVLAVEPSRFQWLTTPFGLRRRRARPCVEMTWGSLVSCGGAGGNSRASAVSCIRSPGASARARPLDRRCDEALPSGYEEAEGQGGS